MTTYASPQVAGRVSAVFGAAAGRLALACACAPPLELRGPFHDDGAPGGTPRYFLRNVTAGVFDGNRYEIRLRAEAGARVRVQPTAATRAYESRGDVARVATHLEVLPGALLTFDAGTTILQQGSNLEQYTELVVHPGGALRYLEVVALGRLAAGERLAFQRFATSLRVRTPGGDELYREAFELLPMSMPELLDSAVGGAGVVGTLLLVGDASALEGDVLDGGVLEGDRTVVAGCGTLPGGGGLIVRALGARVQAVSQLFEDILVRVDSHAR